MSDAEKGGFFDFSSRAKFRLRGSDRLRFLNGQITNDLRAASETEAIEACVLDAKGKIDAHLFISAAPDVCFLDAEAELREALPARLDRYIIADDVEIEDVTGQYGIFHILNSATPTVHDEWKLVRVRRFADAGWDVWVKMAGLERGREIFSSQFFANTYERAETLRIESGLPRWGRELTDEINPVEANLERRCIDYSKGCYIGQEVISRMKMSGQTNKKLCGVVSLNGSGLTCGMRLTALSEQARDAGWVTSVAYSSRLQKQIALGFVKRGFNVPGTHLSALLPADRSAAPAMCVEVVALPFV